MEVVIPLSTEKENLRMCVGALIITCLWCNVRKLRVCKGSGRNRRVISSMYVYMLSSVSKDCHWSVRIFSEQLRSRCKVPKC